MGDSGNGNGNGSSNGSGGNCESPSNAASSGALSGVLGFFGLSSFYNPYGDDPSHQDQLDELKANTQIASAKLAILSLQYTLKADKEILSDTSDNIDFLNNQSEYLFQTGKFAQKDISFISSLAMMIIILVTIFFIITK